MCECIFGKRGLGVCSLKWLACLVKGLAPVAPPAWLGGLIPVILFQGRTPLMQLYIVRHGIAIDREDPKSPPEAERYLTEEGIEKTTLVAKSIAALGSSADLLVSSPYVPPMQTATIFPHSLHYPHHK